MDRSATEKKLFVCKSTHKLGCNVDIKQIQKSVVLTFKCPNILFLQYPEKQTTNIWMITFVLETVVVTIPVAIFNMKTLPCIHILY